MLKIIVLLLVMVVIASLIIISIFSSYYPSDPDTESKEPCTGPDFDEDGVPNCRDLCIEIKGNDDYYGCNVIKNMTANGIAYYIYDYDYRDHNYTKSDFLSLVPEFDFHNLTNTNDTSYFFIETIVRPNGNVSHVSCEISFCNSNSPLHEDLNLWKQPDV